eukprot:5555387-Lingulodinium_polyedra.AAC.1
MVKRHLENTPGLIGTYHMASAPNAAPTPVSAFLNSAQTAEFPFLPPASATPRPCHQRAPE